MAKYYYQLSQYGKHFSDNNEDDDENLIYARLSPAASTATTRPGLWWLLRYSNAFLELWHHPITEVVIFNGIPSLQSTYQAS